MQDMIEVSDKRVAIALLINAYGEQYWVKSVKDRLLMVKAAVEWLKQRLPYPC